MTSDLNLSLAEFDDTMRMVLESGGEFRMYPHGTSMLPLLRQGKDSVVLVAPVGKYLPKKDDIILYQRDTGQYVLHRILQVHNEAKKVDCEAIFSSAESCDDATAYHYDLCGDNQVTLEKGIHSSQIIGVVQRYYRGEKEYSRTSLADQIYRRLWRSFLLRRIYMKLRRISHEKRP